MKLRTGDPWMPAPQYSRSLSGLTLNLLVRGDTNIDLLDPDGCLWVPDVPIAGR